MKIITAALLVLASGAAVAQTYVAPHVRRDGTFVEGHWRSAPDGNHFNNYSAQGNVNPFTGQQGSVAAPFPYGGFPQLQPVQPLQPPQLMQPVPALTWPNPYTR